MAERVAVFIDYQNVYRGARRAFFGKDERLRPSDGQINPLMIAQRLCERGPSGVERELAEVRVYSGRPDSDRDPKTHAAHMRQCEAWERAGAQAITRPLQYLHDQPPQEKGIDVKIALDFVIGAVQRVYDVGILISEDTDLLPAVEFVAGAYDGLPRAELAAWRGRSSRQIHLKLPKGVWCHYLSYEDYQLVRDPTPYARRRR